MMELGLPLIPVVDNATSHLLASAFVGIIMCRAVYILTGYVSVLCFKGYDKLSYKQKMEWNNRGFSTFHALFAASLSLYLLLYSDLFKEDPQDGLIINNYSFLSNSVLGISIGYFLTDLAMILWFYPVLGGLEYLLHHGLSLFSQFLAVISGCGQIYILMVLFTESTTPFVNLRWYLDVAGEKNSKLYMYNGVMLFFGWLVCFLNLVWCYYMLQIYMLSTGSLGLSSRKDSAVHLLLCPHVKTIFPLGLCTLLTVPPMLTMMNVFWFWKIAKGMVKTLSKSRQSQVHNHIQ
ncbi:unnamed protein product [Linum tenue]|uniref:TLC domain-containing protein n=1 Tax=Linum tenue TaxID=586396 RepID=A0AAV0LA77_9ROSI|nr:unnamed protein product [Linum tenue]